MRKPHRALHWQRYVVVVKLYLAEAKQADPESHASSAPQPQAGKDLKGEDADGNLSHPWLHELIQTLQSTKMSRNLANLDVITQDRQSFVTNWSKLIDIGMNSRKASTNLVAWSVAKEQLQQALQL